MRYEYSVCLKILGKSIFNTKEPIQTLNQFVKENYHE